jgi:large subunit ribosomal protein L18
MKLVTKSDYRVRRHMRVRNKVAGTAERPRMSVYISNQHLYVQFIDDQSDRTLASASSMVSEGKGKSLSVDLAKIVGRLAADTAKSKGIVKVVFDRGGFRYAGRLKALADAAREAGLQF